MSAIVSNFRRWWRPPRRAQAREEDRTVTFPELFYDLILTFL